MDAPISVDLGDKDTRGSIEDSKQGKKEEEKLEINVNNNVIDAAVFSNRMHKTCGNDGGDYEDSASCSMRIDMQLGLYMRSACLSGIDGGR